MLAVRKAGWEPGNEDMFHRLQSFKKLPQWYNMYMYLSTCYMLHAHALSSTLHAASWERGDQGIVPRFSKELYDRIEGTTEEQVSGLSCASLVCMLIES